MGGDDRQHGELDSTGRPQPAPGPGPDRIGRARERLDHAKRRELAAHERAIALHERAAELQDRLGRPDRAASARRHAEHARELLQLATVEQASQRRAGR
jgi:hypothetical protein